MIRIRPAAQRGHTQTGWLDSRHTFSFSDYHDPMPAGFRTLRVINDDIVHPGQGSGSHPHRDMEIVTYVIEGALEHENSMGNGSIIHPGEIQRRAPGPASSTRNLMRHGRRDHGQDTEIRAGLLSPGASITHTFRPERHAWPQFALDEVTLYGTALIEGDGAAVSDERLLTINGMQAANSHAKPVLAS